MKATEKRTQIYLPASLHQQATSYARARRLSLAAVIRLSLQERLKRTQRLSKREYDRDPIWRLEGRAESATGDLSSNHDFYLYGGPRHRRRSPRKA
jgi:hypothetical protein